MAEEEISITEFVKRELEKLETLRQQRRRAAEQGTITDEEAAKLEEEISKHLWPQVLREYLDSFREAYLRRAEIGERAAYIRAIQALCGLLMWLPSPFHLSDDDPALNWLEELSTHLGDLDSSLVSPVFQWAGERVSGVSTAEWAGRHWIVHDVETLHAAGMKYEAAAKRVIAGRRLHGVSEANVLSWCKQFRRGEVKNRRVRAQYEECTLPLLTQGCFSEEELQRSPRTWRVIGRGSSSLESHWKRAVRFGRTGL
jgi:hypothetical protein